MKRLLLIVNPISGSGSKDELVPVIEERLQLKGFDVTTRYTSGRGDATEMAQLAVDGLYDTVAVCGGDGTVNETARALCGTGMPMAILPSGSGNGLARHIGLAADELSAIDIITDDNICDCDYGVVNGRKFFCAFGAGFDAAVAEKFDQDGQRGPVTYVKNAFQTFFNYHPKDYTITIDGSTVIDRKAYVVACCNASQYGNNAFIAPGASITDGMFDVVILRDAPHIQTLIAGLDMLTGMLPYNRQVEIIRAHTVDIHAHDTPQTHVDGEPVQMPEDMHIVNVHAGLRLYADLSREKVTPFITPIDNMTRDITAAIAKFFE